MHKIDMSSNRITALTERTFSAIGAGERTHLQEWIAHEPSVLGEDLLIVAKEFSDFDRTSERLDLLALDTSGSLVIIENKIDDAGRDVTWQALKYASYCSRLTKDDVRDMYMKQHGVDRTVAEEAIAEFLDDAETYEGASINSGTTQRIMLVAGNFRPEVTSTVLWLMNYGVRLQCMQATIYSDGDDNYLSIEQIVPIKAAEEFMVDLARKNQSEAAAADVEAARYAIRRKFWSRLLPVMNEKTDAFRGISPNKTSWLHTSAGRSGFGWSMSALETGSRVEFYIDVRDAAENTAAFEKLEAKKDEIEAAFGSALIWEPLPGKRACRVKHVDDGNVFDPDRWDAMIESITDRMPRLISAISPHVRSL